MKMKMKNTLAAFGLLSAAALFAGPASAGGPGYVCWAKFRPGATSKGDHGYIWFTIYTAPSCGGTFDRDWYICSEGATSGSCPSLATMHRTEPAILADYQSLQRATSANQKVNISWGSCIDSSKPSCAHLIEFHAD